MVGENAWRILFQNDGKLEGMKNDLRFRQMKKDVILWCVFDDKESHDMRWSWIHEE